ncbi:cytochrome D1 domain-containing protein [Acidovorax sp. SRB_14]|uniref:YVTN family beta-propeller repeat protein n=1 Tax=Acidovorax sp. SRB_14 TaxID=1962699 RepID=UPI0020B17045|nr:cytochrome D1 domain-containing protein [Acidovorax sp. SRB_14]
MMLSSLFPHRGGTLIAALPTCRRWLMQLVRMVTGAAMASLAIAAFAGGPKAYVGNFKDSTVSVIDTATGAVVATVPVAAGPHGMGITPDGRRVYVGGESSTGISVIDTANDRVVQTIEVGHTPHGLAMAPDGKTLLAGVYGDNRVAFIDVATNAVVATVPVANPHTIAIRPDGKLAYVASQAPGKFALVVIDLASHAVLRSLALDKAPRDPEFGYDGKALYVTVAGLNAIEVLDPETDKTVAEVPTGVSPHVAKLYRGAAFATAVVQGPGELQLFDPVTNKSVRSIAVGKQPHWQASVDGKTVYVTNEGSNDVSAVDLATGQTKAIAVGTAPRKIVVQPSATGTAAAQAVISAANLASAPAAIAVARGPSVA